MVKNDFQAAHSIHAVHNDNAPSDSAPEVTRKKMHMRQNTREATDDHASYVVDHIVRNINTK